MKKYLLIVSVILSTTTFPIVTPEDAQQKMHVFQQAYRSFKNNMALIAKCAHGECTMHEKKKIAKVVTGVTIAAVGIAFLVGGIIYKAKRGGSINQILTFNPIPISAVDPSKQAHVQEIFDIVKNATYQYPYKPLFKKIEEDPSLAQLVDQEGNTLLHHAANKKVYHWFGFGHSGATGYVVPSIAQYFDLNAQNNNGDTPLHLWVNGANLSNIVDIDPGSSLPSLITARTINLNVQNNQGDTPLHIAARELPEKYEDVLYTLLDRGSQRLNPCLKNNEGKTAAQVASTPKRNQAILAYEKKHGKKWGCEIR